MRIPLHAASLGGVESLVVRPSRSSHLGLDEESRQRLGITDDLVRVSVGIEDADELIEDFGRALGRLAMGGSARRPSDAATGASATL